MQQTMTLVALCAAGAEKVLSNELRKLDGEPAIRIVDSGFGRVRFETDLAGIYRSLMALRSADRVLLEAAFFPAGDFDALFKGASAAPWEAYIPAGMGLRVSRVRVNRSRLAAVTSIQAVVHKAAAGRLCGKQGVERLPEQGPQAEIRVYVEKDSVSLLLDLSGEPLFRRGYRTEGGIAPLRETTAAAILLLSGWKRKFPLYDPFCGAGTILVEAAMYAWDMAPGIRRRFALSDLLVADRDIEEAVREELVKKINFERTIRIAGSDADGRSVAMAKSNAERAYDLACGRPPAKGARSVVRFPFLPDIRTLEAKDALPPQGEGGFEDSSGFIVTNPPYGRRLGDTAEAEKTYGEMAGLPRRFPGWKLAVISDNPGFESFFGSKASSCREITNGAFPAYFFQYDPGNRPGPLVPEGPGQRPGVPGQRSGR
ncbi:MAG: class I SAM-dependent RNA methyltransferase [Treponema sp.]|nr:class I SAM-dependent RNA methyltransferase [Treponema sp.]